MGWIKHLRRMLDTCTVVINQHRIVNQTQSNRIIALEPVPLHKKGGGNIEHYYHFIFDLILPLHLLIKKAHPKTLFVLRDFGIYTHRIKDLFSNRIAIKNQLPKSMERYQLMGMNPHWVCLKKNDLENFKKDIFRSLEIYPRVECKKIVLIERLPPEPYFMTRATLKGGGTLRRSILNHQALASTLASMVKAPYEFHNLQLEKISLREQVQFFSEALIILGQHGAGLVNCIWMRQHSLVIELGDNAERDHFQTISRLRNHDYFFYKTSGSHVIVDINDFSTWILGNIKLKQFFRNPQISGGD